MLKLFLLVLLAATVHAQGNAAHGKELFLKYSCYACHGFSGQNGPGARLVDRKQVQERRSHLAQ